MFGRLGVQGLFDFKFVTVSHSGLRTSEPRMRGDMDWRKRVPVNTGRQPIRHSVAFGCGCAGFG